MKSLLFAVFLKPGMLDVYRKFAAEITGPRKREYSELLKRYGLTTAKVWIEKIESRDRVVIYHDVEETALDRLKHWSSSTHPFDLWFAEQLALCYENFPDPAHSLFEFNASN